MSDSPLATADEAAEFLRATKQQLAQQRFNGTGPRYVKNGRRVLYRWADLQSYVEANTYERTDQKAATA